MNSIRRRASAIAMAWLMMQLSLIAATPVTLFHALSEGKTAGQHVCCPGMAPGQYCPMHKHWNGGAPAQKSHSGSRSCALTNGCTPLLAGLEAFSLWVATISAEPGTPDGQSADDVTVVGEQPFSRAVPPKSPPPRA